MIAVLDWGSGGADVFRQLRDALSGLHFIYLSDAGYPPYGTVEKALLRERLEQICSWLRGRACRRLVVACNAMSSAFVPEGETIGEVWVTGMLGDGIPAAHAMAQGLGLKRLLVLGGRRTVRSGIWARPLRERGFMVRQRIGQALSALIEAGRQAEPECLSQVKKICGPLTEPCVLVLACTHYPALRPLFEARYPHCVVFDPASAVVAGVVAETGAQAVLPAGAGPGDRAVEAFTTGEPGAAALAAWLGFGVSLPFQPWHGLELHGQGTAD